MDHNRPLKEAIYPSKLVGCWPTRIWKGQQTCSVACLVMLSLWWC